MNEKLIHFEINLCAWGLASNLAARAQGNQRRIAYSLYIIEKKSGVVLQQRVCLNMAKKRTDRSTDAAANI
jgi:hypothetical protein